MRLQLHTVATRCQTNSTLSSARPLQNKEFVCRGHDYERLEAFQQRMLNEFPHAIAMQHVNQPDQTIYQADAQCILGCREMHMQNLSPRARTHKSVMIRGHQICESTEEQRGVF